jgi:hypothetical protein
VSNLKSFRGVGVEGNWEALEHRAFAMQEALDVGYGGEGDHQAHAAVDRDEADDALAEDVELVDGVFVLLVPPEQTEEGP